MNANWSYHIRRFTPPKNSIRSLAVLASLLICLITNSAMAQVTNSPQTEPVDPVREKQKEAYFKQMKEAKSTSIEKQEVPDEFSAEPLPNWNDTGDFEVDKAAYLLAVKGWLERNASLYSEEELEFLKKPILKLEERQRNLNNN